MKQVELHSHYLRQLVPEKIITLVYCSLDGQLANLFTKILLEAKFVKFSVFSRPQEDTIMGVCTNVISPPKSPKYCVDGVCWNHMFYSFIISLDLLETISRLINWQSS